MESGATSGPVSGAKHTQITAALRTELRHMPVGERLPSEREMAERFEVSRMTLRQALDQLQSEGWLERVRGSGTFTRRPTVAMGPAVTSFTEDMRRRDLVPSSRLLGFTRAAPEPDVRAALELTDGSEVIWMERLRFADDEPICLEVTQFPARLERALADGDLEQSVHEVLRSAGVSAWFLKRQVRATLATDREARLLQLPHGAPALEVLDVFADPNGRPFQHARSRYRFDRYEVQMSATRGHG